MQPRSFIAVSFVNSECPSPRASGNEGLVLSWHALVTRTAFPTLSAHSNLPPPPLPEPTLVIPLTNQTLPRTVSVGGTRAGPHLHSLGRRTFLLGRMAAEAAETLQGSSSSSGAQGIQRAPPCGLLEAWHRAGLTPGLSEPSPRALGHEKQSRCVQGPDTQAQLCP